MAQSLELNRPERIRRLACLGAPPAILQNEVRLAIGEYMDQDIEKGCPTGFAWGSAAWCLAVLLVGADKELAGLKLEVRRLRQELKAKEAAK